ncbi:hypothetical protein F5J12DRAFT_848513 [Pisolithus orientalis]|uniref:uncharacterized protein n=1 Tax=Pisolithus orientalis TaxID=936130 RepID=UPI0022257350|nr:uncharacterized protein F5J12DRAFT_848513 [Pisolithus orientalis]KAI5998946.1 hypothetical protein F5J12DRAFT_848513 [Pisolithus orientalis]
MQARRYRSTHVACLRWEPLSLSLKGSWPANFSIPSFISAIHFATVVVKSCIVSLPGRSSSSPALASQPVQGHIKSITQLASVLKYIALSQTRVLGSMVRQMRLCVSVSDGMRNLYACLECMETSSEHFPYEDPVVKVVLIEADSKTLMEAVNEAMRDWNANLATTHFLSWIPHAFPYAGRD